MQSVACTYSQVSYCLCTSLSGQEVLVEAKMRLKDVSKNPASYKRLLTDFLVQVREKHALDWVSLLGAFLCVCVRVCVCVYKSGCLQASLFGA